MVLVLHKMIDFSKILRTLASSVEKEFGYEF